MDYLETISFYLRNADRVYIVIYSVSRSGMSRNMAFFVINDGKLVRIDSLLHHVCGFKRHRRDGLVINGCGMDMGFHAVSEMCGRLGIPVIHHEYL